MKRAIFIAGVLAATSLSYADTTNADKILTNVGIDQKLGATPSQALPFTDENGKAVTLKNYLDGRRPVILNLVYYECPMLCTEVLNGLNRTLKVLSLKLNQDFRIVSVSISPRETPTLAREKKTAYIQRYNRPGMEEGWSFLTGPESSIRPLADSVGFRYAWDPQIEQYAHGATIIVLTPDGRVSHYFMGVEYSPKDLRLSLLEASQGKIGSLVDKLLLYCYRYDPTRGKYGLVIMRVMRIGAVATVFILAFVLFFWFRAEKRVLRLRAD